MAAKKKYDVGTIHILKNGNEIKILEKLDDSKVKILFTDGNEIKIVKSSQLSKGYVKNPNKIYEFDVGTLHFKNGIEYEVIGKDEEYVLVLNKSTNTKMKCILNSLRSGCFVEAYSPRTKYKIGQVFTSNKGDKFIIIEVLEYPHCKIKFLDKYGYECISQRTHIKSGNIRNPYRKSYYNVGYIGEPNYEDCNYNLCMNTWDKMMSRCYCEATHKVQPNYIGTIVCDDWLNFSNFQKWFNDTHIEGCALDKDLRQLLTENKIYSPSTCTWLTRKINNFIALSFNNATGFIGVYDTKYNYNSSILDFDTGKSIYLGVFTTKEEAFSAYLNEKKNQILKAKTYMKKLNYAQEVYDKLDDLIEVIIRRCTNEEK